MTKQYYECHVTMEGDKSHIEKCVESIGWKFSAIDKDIILGDGVKCYATMHYSKSKYADEQIIAFVEDASYNLASMGCNVIRSKVELVVFDRRSL